MAKFSLTREFYKDLNWFSKFLQDFNGKVFYSSKQPEIQVYVDACLTGLGAIWNSQVYAANWPPYFYHSIGIVHLEMLNVFVALKLWGKFWHNSTVRVHCDNTAVVSVLNTHRTRDMHLLACCRNIWLLLAKYNINLIASHIPGSCNILADALSRWGTLPHKVKIIMSKLLKDAQWHSLSSEDFYLDWNI